MPWSKVSDEQSVPPAGGAASLRRNRSITLADVDRNRSSSVHPAAAAPAPHRRRA